MPGYPDAGPAQVTSCSLISHRGCTMTSRKNSDTYLPRRALTRAVCTGAGAIALAALATACSSATSTPTARGAASATRPPAAAKVSTSAAAPSAQPTAALAAQPSTAASTQPYAADVLAPATVPSVSGVCSFMVTYTADGNVTPLVCLDGSVNAQAWDFYARLGNSELLTLGRGATEAQVYQAMCHDYTDLHMTKPETDSTEEIAGLYYGWVVSPASLSRQLVEQGCAGS